MIFKKLHFVIIALLVSATGFTQENREFLNNRILYTKYTVADFFNDTTKWAWEFDVVYRRQSQLGKNDFYTEPLRISVRPWIAYQFTKLTRVSFNPVGLFSSAPRMPTTGDLDKPFERELRTTLQINNYAYYGRVNFTHRLRFESRWRDIDNPEGAVHNFRVRYRIRTRIPVNSDYFYKNNTIYVSQYSEIHTEFGKNYGTNYLSQNRNYLGLGYRFWDWTRIELGYIFQLNPRGNNYQIDVSQGPMFYLFMDLLSKNKRRYNYSF